MQVPDYLAALTNCRDPVGSRARKNATDPIRVADRLHSAAIHLLRRLRREDEATALPAPLLSALSVLVFGGPITLGDLARAEQVRPPTVTRVVGRLTAAGLARRTRDRADRRVIRLTATAKGRRILLAGRARRVSRLAGVIRRLNPGEMAALSRALDIIDASIRPGLAADEGSR